jgi:hypothetical protein
MNKYPLIGGSICAVVLIVLASLTNVVGYQTVQTSQQNLIKERINQRELLFQTICDIANNKEIQRIILKSQMSRGIFLVFDIPVFTKNQLKQMYFIGSILTKIVNKIKIHSIIKQYQSNNQDLHKKIITVIENNADLKEQLERVTYSNCSCDTSKWELLIKICNVTETLIYFVILPITEYLYNNNYKFLFWVWWIFAYPALVVLFTIFVFLCIGVYHPR